MKGRQSNWPVNLSNPNPREYRLQLTKITENLPYGDFLAYCIVSKQSSNGLLVHQMFLTINTYAKQLSYYTKIPSLPIKSLKETGEPKQVVNYQTANRFEFLLERIRIGHVNVRWIQKNESKSWKLIIGSNKLAQQLQQIIMMTSGRANTDSYRRSRGESSNKQNTSLQHQNDKKIAKQESFKEENLQITVTRPQQSQKKQLKQIDITIAAKSSRPEIYSPISLENQFIQQKISDKANLDPDYRSISMNKAENYSTSQKKNYQKYDLLLQKKQEEPVSLKKSQSLANQWLQATNSQQKATVYLKFVSKCKKKIELIMQNFFASHLQHEEQDNICFLYDGQTNYYYCPLIQNLESEGTAEDLTRKILEEEQFLREFQCFDYLSNIDNTGQFKIVFPMACIISYKAMKFYCKNTLDFVTNKSIITKNMNEYKVLLNQFEKKCHLKFSGEEQIYEIITKQKTTLIYLNKARCLPQISNNLPISRYYMESYITQGVVSSEKDIKAIKSHIMNLVGQDLIQHLTQRHLFSCHQMMVTIEKLGMSYHFLPLVIQQAQKHKLNYLYRVLLSELLAKSMQWQIRRKMQLQIFKKRQFGFSINQLKMSINMLFQQQKYYLRLLSKIIKSYFGFSFSFEDQILENNILAQMTLISLLYKLGFHCRVDLQYEQYQGWIWKERNIEDRLHLTPHSQITAYSPGSFNDKNQHFLERCLIKQINFQIQDTKLQQVCEYLGVEKDKNGLYVISPSYQLLKSNIKTEVNYYLSHFLTLSHGPTNVLQSTIYQQFQQQQFFRTSFQYLILINKGRWLIKEGFKSKAEEIIEKQIQYALLWNQSLVLIQIYDFYAKYKLKFGEIKQALEYSLKSLQTALWYYQQVSTIPTELLIAEQAFQAANIHLLTHDFTKSLDLFSIAQKIIKKISTEGESITLNPQFILLYSRKCQIFLIFGQYQNCLDQCLEGLQCSTKFKHFSIRLFVDQNEFKLYEILFRCYETKNMRKQMIQVAKICSAKYFEDKVQLNQPIDQNLLSEVVKLIWISIVKQVEMISPISERLDTQIEEIKYIYLKKIHKQLIILGKRLRFQYRYSKKEIADYFKRIIVWQNKVKNIKTLKNAIVGCLASVTMSSQGFKNDKIFAQEALESPWLMLQSIACMNSYEFLVGIIQNSLHLYNFQY